MTSPYSRIAALHAIDDERGVTLILFASAAVCLLILAGLALDSGNVYNARLAVQAAADAGAVAGGTMRAVNVDVVDSMVAAAEIARRNLELKQVTDDTNLGTVDPQFAGELGDAVYDPDTNRAQSRTGVYTVTAQFDPGSVGVPPALTVNPVMTVTVEARVPLVLLGFLPGEPGFRTVSSVATTEITPATVALLLDTSESMACPDSAACACMGACDQSPNSGARIDNLKAAVTEFLNFFDEQRDSISVTAFGTGAEVIAPMNANGFVKQDVIATVNGLQAAGATNLSDAIFRSYLDARSQGREATTAYVAFVDGAPTAGRYFFSNVKGGNSPNNPFVNNPLGESFSYGDYINWSVSIEFDSFPGVDVGDPGPQDEMVQASVPSALYKTPFTPEAITYLRTLGGAQAAQYAIKDPRFLYRFGWPSVPDPQNPYAFALNSLEVLLPNGSPRRLGPQVNFPNTPRDENLYLPNGHFQWNLLQPVFGDGRFEILRALYYDMATIAADFVRTQGGEWYVVGYGQPAPFSTDPYQRTRDAVSRKDIFLTRASVDICGLLDGHPSFPNPGIDSLFDLLTSGATPGNYYPIKDARSMKRMFGSIGRKIRVGLVQ